MGDAIHRPDHYCFSEYEPRKVIHSWGLNFNLGNAIKYIARAGRKGDILEDLYKAKEYITFEIEEIEAKRAKALVIPNLVVTDTYDPNPDKGNAEVIEAEKEAVKALDNKNVIYIESLCYKTVQDIEAEYGEVRGLLGYLYKDKDNHEYMLTEIKQNHILRFKRINNFDKGKVELTVFLGGEW